MILHPLFHWAPADRRAGIQRNGLRINAPPTVDSQSWDRICASPSPSHAWAHSAAQVGTPGDAWDLWQISLGADDEIRIEPITGNRIGEIRIHTSIPADRLWLAGTRTVPADGKPR